MAADGQQYSEDNFAEDQQYSEYNEQSYGEEQYQQDGMMVEGGDQSGQVEDVVNGSGDPSLPPKAPSDEDRKLFIGGISWDTEQKDLKEYFSKYGEVTDVTIKTDPNTGKSRGFGFITFATEEAVDNVLRNVPHTVKGKQIDPKRAKLRPGVKKIFVGGLDADFPEAEIKAYFEKYGKVENVELPFDKVKNQRRQFCFVTFETEDACEASCKQSKQKIGNKECDIKKATTTPSVRGGRGGAAGGWPVARGGRGRGGRGRGASNFAQPQGWGAQGYGGAYGSQGYGYNQNYGGYGNYGNYDYSGYGGGYGGGYGNYDYSGWNYGQSGYGNAGYGQQQSNYGKTPRRGGATGAAANAGGGYHPYSR